MNVFTFHDYRALLYSAVEGRKFTDPGFGFQSLAAIAGVQKSYLSKVLHGSADLNADQLFLIAEFFRWNEEESSFVELLLEWERCALSKRKQFLKKKIEGIQKSKGTGASEKSPPTQLEAPEYFLDPWVIIVHAALAIPRYAEDFSLIAEDLRIDASHVRQAVDILVRLGQAEWKGRVLRLLHDLPSLPKESPLYQSWLMQSKLNSIQRMQQVKKEKPYSLNHVFASDEETRLWLKGEFLNLLKRAGARLQDGKKQNVYQINFDLFSWTKD